MNSIEIDRIDTIFGEVYDGMKDETENGEISGINQENFIVYEMRPK